MEAGLTDHVWTIRFTGSRVRHLTANLDLRGRHFG
jgi:hypothetical protein